MQGRRRNGAEEKMGEKHLRLDRPDAERRYEVGREQRGLQESCWKIRSSAPTVERLRDDDECSRQPLPLVYHGILSYLLRFSSALWYYLVN